MTDLHEIKTHRTLTNADMEYMRRHPNRLLDPHDHGSPFDDRQLPPLSWWIREYWVEGIAFVIFVLSMFGIATALLSA